MIQLNQFAVGAIFGALMAIVMNVIVGCGNDPHEFTGSNQSAEATPASDLTQPCSEAEPPTNIVGIY